MFRRTFLKLAGAAFAACVGLVPDLAPPAPEGLPTDTELRWDVANPQWQFFDRECGWTKIEPFERLRLDRMTVALHVPKLPA